MFGAPGGIRTPDHLVRSQVLYPAELQAHVVGPHSVTHWPHIQYDLLVSVIPFDAFFVDILTQIFASSRPEYVIMSMLNK